MLNQLAHQYVIASVIFTRIYSSWVGGHRDRPAEKEGRRENIVTYQKVPRSFQRFRALLQKRLLYQWRTPFLFLTGCVLPVVIAYAGLGTIQVQIFRLPPAYRRIDLDVAAFFGPDQRPLRTFLQDAKTPGVSLTYKVLLESANVPFDVMENALANLVKMSEDDFIHYLSTYAFGTVFNDTRRTIEMWTSPVSLFGQSVLRNIIDTVLLRVHTGDPKSRIRTAFSVYTLTKDEAHIRWVLAYTWVYWGIIASASFGLVTSSFAVLSSAEVCSEARELQLMTGVSGLLYFGAHFLFDLAFYMLPMATMYGGFAVIFQLSEDSLVSLLIIALAFAPLGVLLPYLISEYAADGGTAYATVLVLFSIGGPAALVAYATAADVFKAGSIARQLFMFFPPFTLQAATARAANLKYEVTICDYLRGKNKLDDDDRSLCGDWVYTIAPAVGFCCDTLKRNTSAQEWYEPKVLSFSPYGILWDVLFMVSLGSVLFVCLLYRVSGLSTRGRESDKSPVKADPMPEDEDVAAERAVVEDICKSKSFGDNTLVARNLHKMFGKMHAVRGLSFALRPAECFGLLGVNGAGKTTTFRMLAALIRITYGDAYMKDVVLSEDPRKWQSKLGYCPQSGALLEKLNAFETLYLFGRLRGVPEEILASVVDNVINVTDLREHAAKKCEYYSGGNKRKLSIAVALIGFPEVVFLDEPYAGVDILATARIFGGLTQIKDKIRCTLVLTSHSMEDCELSCDRMCIMVQGEMMCLGTLQRLKDKFGKGYRLQFILPDDSKLMPEELGKSVVSSFPKVTVVDIEPKVLEFRIEEKLKWSELFEKIATLEKAFVFEHILVSDNTLEQIFIEFARKTQVTRKGSATDV